MGGGALSPRDRAFRRPLALFAAGFGGGTALGVLLLPAGAQLPAAALFALLAVVAALSGPRLGPVLRRCALLCCVGAAVGLAWTWGYARLYHDPVRALDGRWMVLDGEVTDWPSAREKGGAVDLRVRLPGGGSTAARLFYGEGWDELQPGDRVTVSARCTFADHTAAGEETSWFTARGILLTAVTDGIGTVLRPDRIPLRRIPAFLANGLKRGIAAALPAADAPLVTAVVTGDRSGLDRGFSADLRRTGLSHMTAVSGMHMVFLVSLLELLLGRSRRRTALVCVPVTVLFALMTGAAPSVVRAAVMVDLLLLAPLFDRERDDLTALGAALLLLLGLDPYAAADVGLQLSFGAVLGILTFSARIRAAVLSCFGRGTDGGPGPAGRALRGLASSLGATFGALAFTVPVSALQFGSVSLIAPLSNLLVLWAVSLIFVLGVVSGAVSAVLPALGAVPAMPAALLVRFLRQAVTTLARVSFAAIPMDELFCRLWLILVYAVAALALLAPGRKRLWVTLSACGATLGAALLLSVLALRAGPLTVRALDVGQGQCVLIRSGGDFVLCDCGGDAYPGAGFAAAEDLERAGSRTLDLLVLSHYDADHVNGVGDLLDLVNVKQITLPDTEPDDPVRLAILDRAEARGVPVRFIRTRQEIPLDGGVLTLLPPRPGAEGNGACLAALYTRGSFDVLVTGDLDKRAERALLERERLPDTELMIAGHHGAAGSNSEELLAAVRPEAVIVSAGAHNLYGHPAPQALERFARAGARVYRTDRQGTIMIRAWPDAG